MPDKTPKQDDELDTSLEELLRELNSELDGAPTQGSTAASAASDKKAHYTMSSFPTEMSCSQAFDQLVACYSIGGQVRHVYRHGGISYCDGRWAKLRFCLQMKAVWDEEEKAKRVSRFYMQKLAEKKKQVGSSEDVWAVRTVPILNPFKDDLYELREQEHASGTQPPPPVINSK